MKRYISLLLILPLVIAAVAAPVSAAEANYGVYNLLDYSQIQRAHRTSLPQGGKSYNPHRCNDPQG